MKTLIILLAPIILFSSCKKYNENTWVEFTETSCYPGWLDIDSKRKTKQFLEGFLRGNDVIPLDINVKGERIETCSFCDCATGIIYKVKINKSQKGLIGYYGFY